MEFRVLGPFEALDDGIEVRITASKQRALLAILVLRAGTTVPGHRLINELWNAPPVSARKVLQTYISKLRQVLPQGMLLTRPAGYTLCLEPEDLDAARFERLLSEAARLPAAQEVQRLRRALSLWRGRAWEDFADEPFAQPDAARLEALRLEAHVRCCELDLAAGRHRLVLGELGALSIQNPTDERLRGLLMLALYRSGRQADALRVYRDARRALVAHLGLEPSEPLRRLEQAILRHDAALDLTSVAASPAIPDAVERADAAGVPPVAAAKNLRAGTPPPHRTQRYGDSFVGRGREIEQLRALLRGGGSRLITLSGPAGTGKTRLAMHVAGLVADDYPDGVTAVDLTRVDQPGHLAPAVCSAVGLHPGGQGEAPGDPADLLAAFLAPRESLLVLDNFEHLLAGAALVERLLADAPRLTVLTTSRAPLGLPEEDVFTMFPLAVPGSGLEPEAVARTDAVLLFVDRARAARPGFELTSESTDTVGRLCARLDGLPLAIELAAARIDVLSPRAILSRLDGRLDLLATDATDATDAAGSHERHRSVRAALDWSYRLLDERTQTIFCDLSVFAGGFTVGTAEAVVSPGPGLTADAVRILVRASLLRSIGSPGDEPRFGMLETIRDYGRAQLESNRRGDAVRAAHARAFRMLAEEAELQLRGPDQVRWLDLIEAELPNIREALRWSAHGGDADMGLYMTAGLWRFWQVRGPSDEPRQYVEAMLATSRGSVEARAGGHLTVARCAFHQGDSTAVQHHASAALPVHRECGDAYAVGFALMLLGASIGRGEDPERGAALLHEALEHARSARDSWLESSCLGYLGMVASAQGNFVEARHLLEDGLRGGRELGDSRMVGWFLIGLGRVALAAGDTVRARRRFQEAMTWERRLQDAWGEAWALHGLAGVSIQEDVLPDAVGLLVECLGRARRAQANLVAESALRLLATAAFSAGRPDLAAQLLGGASLASPVARSVWSIDADGVATVTPDALIAAIGPEGVDEHWARGRAQTTDDLIASATRELTQS
jgi:predicted ATPase/DNA-binding SARP family transcriptional activator